MTRFHRFAAGLLASAAVAATSGSAIADHAWENLHWARTSNPFTVVLGDNLSSSWDSYLAVAAGDWSARPDLMFMDIRPGVVTNPKTCKPASGRVEICNAKYGLNGWVGIASVWSVSGGHIVQGTVKMNESYYALSRYNTPEWRQLVLCQEIGHTLGLDHQDENFNNTNLGTCMDYSNTTTGQTHPNLHDYDQLEEIYSHLDTTNTSSGFNTSRGGLGQDGGDSPGEWGRAIAFTADGLGRVYVKDAGPGVTLTTFVYWAPDSTRHRPDNH
jgi:hypothetical protein